MRFISCAVFLVLILFSVSASAEIIPMSNFSRCAYNSQNEYTPLDDMEQRLFSRTFGQENDYRRLNRIENRIFNRTFRDLPVNIRIQNVMDAINSNKTNDMATQYLDFAESQIFRTTYPQNDPSQRLERLEIQIFGAIQSGDILSRIENIKRSTTNVASGGYGLQYARPYNNYNNYSNVPIVGTQSNKKSLFQSLAPVVIPFLGNYTNTAPSSYSYGPYDQTYSSYNNYNPHNNYMQFGGMGSNNSNSIQNGSRNDFGNDYGMGGSIRILED